jgi:hypothetical protein
MKNKVILPFVLLMLAMNVFFISCEKNTECKANIKCVNDAGQPLQNATVRLYANVKTSTGGTVTADLKANGVTDAGGLVSFVFKLPAIYDITATTTAVGSGSAAITSTIVGNGIIKLEEGKTVDKSVTLK